MKVLLITANVGSLFGDKTGIRRTWIKHMFDTIKNECVGFVALNLQESGGKCFKLHSKEVLGLMEELNMHLCDLGYKSCCAFLDIDYELNEEYTVC